MDPATLLISAGLGGIGSYFQGDAEKQAAEEARKVSLAQLAEQERQFNVGQTNRAAGSAAIGANYNTTGYGSTLNYQNPYSNAVDTSINAFLSGSLMPAEVTQQGKDIATAGQGINAGAATMGLPAGARAALIGNSASDITGQYANLASGRIGQGIGLANTAATTGANIASMNYQTGLSNFLNQQAEQNKKAQLLAGYATGG